MRNIRESKWRGKLLAIEADEFNFFSSTFLDLFFFFFFHVFFFNFPFIVSNNDIIFLYSRYFRVSWWGVSVQMLHSLMVASVRFWRFHREKKLVEIVVLYLFIHFLKNFFVVPSIFSLMVAKIKDGTKTNEFHRGFLFFCETPSVLSFVSRVYFI